MRRNTLFHFGCVKFKVLEGKSNDFVWPTVKYVKLKLTERCGGLSAQRGVMKTTGMVEKT